MIVSITEKNDWSIDTYFEISSSSVIFRSIRDDVKGKNNFYWDFTVNGYSSATGADNTYVYDGDTLVLEYKQVE